MSVQLDLPFARGTTFFGSNTPDLTIGKYLEGKEYLVPDSGPTQTIYPTGGRVDGTYIRLRIVRNVSGIALSPKRLVTFLTDGTVIAETRVDGYADTDAERAYPVDDAYAASGSGTLTIANNDLFYIVVNGPCLCSTGLAAGVRTSIAVGDPLVAQTAVTSGATTSGRIGELDASGSTSAFATQLLGVVGRAMSASTTNQTGTDILVSVGKW